MTKAAPLLKDQLFNVRSVGQLGREYAAAIPGFDRERFERDALGGFETRELMARMDWLADCLERQLSPDFKEMAAELEAAMPPALSPDKTDDDFGQFIHAIPGILAVRHGLEHYRSRAMQLLYRATQRFSMEFYVRPFLIRWPEETLAQLHDWALDDHYHVRRLVSEGTRPQLPWARAVNLSPEQTLPLLDKLHGDPTRYVTRSVANHLNDLSKTVPDAVVDRLSAWRGASRQNPKELDWITRHALRTLVKRGHPAAMATLGFPRNVPFDVSLELQTARVRIGEALRFSVLIHAPGPARLMVDYRIRFHRPNGKTGEKVFKLKQGRVDIDTPFQASKSHMLKADASTFTWHAGPHLLTLQVNGEDRISAEFDVI